MKKLRILLSSFNSIRRYSGKSVRVRFAPSPTGFLHLGGLRTALYNYLFARSHNGKFILRIEDTDQTRIVADAVSQIQNDLEWLGITPDESPKGGPFGPYVQSERRQLYLEQVDKLISSGAAYYCFCTEKRLELLKKDAVRMRQVPKYDNHCRHLSNEEIKTKLASGIPKCVRFKLVPSEPFSDLVYGRICHDVMEIEGDPILLKSDCWPTYHLANVIDDHFMEISHVIRGVEWIQSTNKHLMIYKALNYEPPKYAHLPLILNSDGTKLSKRQNDLSIKSLRKNGIFPNALLNFLVQAGSGFKDTQSGFSINKLVQNFNIKNVSTNSTKLPLERLEEFNRLELSRKLQDEEETKNLILEVQNLVKDTFKNHEIKNLELDDEHVKTILIWSLPRITKLSDLVSNDLNFLWVKPKFNKIHNFKNYSDVLQTLKNDLLDVKFDIHETKSYLRQFSKDKNVPFKELMALLRSVLSDLEKGPGVAEMLVLLGKTASLKRLEEAHEALGKIN